MMVYFPVLQKIDVDDYGLYPGTRSKPGLHASLQSGLTLVLGANGLGKTTLVLLLYRLCTGPVDIPGLSEPTELGYRKLEPKRLSPADRRVFAARVADEAQEAQATLTMELGGAVFEITRSLKDISLLALVVDGQPLPSNERALQEAVLRHAGLASFGDWILILRHITFYFEQRRALVWDPTAQRQVIRALFLPPSRAQEWTRLERAVLELDSRFRNLQAVLNREEREADEAEVSIPVGNDLEQALTALRNRHSEESGQLASLDEDLVQMDAERQSARLDALQADMSRDSALRELEHQRLRAIEASFPSQSETAKYILVQLLANDECLVCGSHVPDLANELGQRITDGRCVVCDSGLPAHSPRRGVGRRHLRDLESKLEKAEERAAATAKRRLVAEEAYENHINQIARLQRDISVHAAEIDVLVRRLPVEGPDLAERRSQLAGMRGRVEVLRRDLSRSRRGFARFVKAVNLDVVSRTSALKAAFEGHARGFLLEDCALVWSPHRDKVGQSGELVEFPSYELQMTGTNFASPVRRSGPDQVSESQREFIDLSFRMALMEVSDEGSGGTLVIDAPESSLDAVFVSKAAEVLTRFARAQPANRLILTSNLVQGQLIPDLLRRSGIRNLRSPRIVDLFDIAAPTAATTQLHGEYASVKEALFGDHR